MTQSHHTSRLALIRCAIALLLVVVRPATAAPAASEDGASYLGVVANAVSTTASVAPGFGGDIHKLMTRIDHSLGRLASIFGRVGGFWFSAVVSSLLFLLVAAVSSVADLRLFNLRRYGPGATSRYLAYGVRTFFRILRDRRTPYSARVVLVGALLYWLVPLDIVSDATVLPGFVDDLVVTILASKGFIYMCPDSLVAAHAAAVERRAQVHAPA